MNALIVCVGFLAAPDEIVLRDGLVIGPPGKFERSILHQDAIEAEIVAGRAVSPKAGDELKLPDGTSLRWEPIRARDDGWFAHDALGKGGYVFLSVESASERVMILDAAGHSLVYVNGEPRAGDPYQMGIGHLPGLLRAGSNGRLFPCARGRMRAKLVIPTADALFDASDMTLPDDGATSGVDLAGAIVVRNASTRPMEPTQLDARIGDASSTTTVPTLAPLSARKISFDLPQHRPNAGAASSEVRLRLLRKRKILDETTVTLRVRLPNQGHRRTFRSSIDDSVQFYAVLPARPQPQRAPAPALVLSLHGAGVDAMGQADSYAAKSWATIVAPTNRRPFGFDWEDWGRRDAMEVLDLARASLDTDPRRTYLTGHSMGGHGTWHIGATYPDRFAALGPSAGWPSFSSYAGAAQFAGGTSIEEILQRAISPSDTLALSRNYLQHGIYILHGDADDNVPIDQARTMRDRLATFHHDFVLFEQPKAGHWWDASDEPGVDCVDWAPMFDFFARHAIPDDESVRDVDFTTMNPAISSRCHWVEILAQTHSLRASHAALRFDPGKRRFTGTTDNVARLALDLAPFEPDEPVNLEVDGTKLAAIPWPKDDRRLWLAREGDAWAVATRPSPSLKGPARAGPFKEAFRHHVVFVYGTRGTPEENAWAIAKARFDAETFGYRGNGSIDVVADSAFDASRERDRNVILYGDADTNAAWPPLLGSSPVVVRHGRVTIGDRSLGGEDLACLFVRPRADSDVASVAAVSGSGIAGMRLADRLPIFLSGTAYPDCIVVGPDVLAKGIAGVRVAGFFGPDWSIASGDFAWRP
ncbi:MAG: prolyl oligopeptidase family serine peptidase [Planctomycetes bacterium]|nr:prolyl oligopeptidase family serine peptidase [Planctomycetota bacterium]